MREVPIFFNPFNQPKGLKSLATGQAGSQAWTHLGIKAPLVGPKGISLFEDILLFTSWKTMLLVKRDPLVGSLLVDRRVKGKTNRYGPVKRLIR